MNNVKKGLVIITVLVFGITIGRFTLPAKIVEKEHIVYQDKIIEKQVEVINVKKKDHKIYTKIEKQSPDGTKTIETHITTDNSVDITDNKTNSTTKATTTVEDKTKETTYSTQNTLVLLGVKTSPNVGYDYGLFINKRLLGPVYVGAFGFTDRSFGLNVGLSF